MRILLIEPDSVLAQTYRQALTDMAEVHSAQNGQQAIELIDDIGQLDLIILELQLPGLNGIVFLQELRSYADTQHTPVIIQSYMHEPSTEDLDVIREAFGIGQWLYKPRTTLGDLRKVVIERHKATV